LAFKSRFFKGEERAFNMFDIFVVASGMLDFFNIGQNFVWLRVARAVVKVFKALRVLRMVKFFQELRLIMLGMAHSMRTFFWSMVALLLMMYVCAIVLVQGVAEYLMDTPYDKIDAELLKGCVSDWGSVRIAIISEFKSIAGGAPWGTITDPLWHAGQMYYYFFLLFIAVMALVFLKLITGIFVQKAKMAADTDRDMMIESTMVQIFKDADLDNSGTISLDEFRQCINGQEAKHYWQMLHINPSDAKKLFALMDESGDMKVDIEEFVQGCRRFSGFARNIDMAVAVCRIHEVSMHLVEFMAYVEECFDSIFGHRGAVPTLTSATSAGERHQKS